MLNNFIANDSGAVTVDWVVLTAALVGLGLAVMTVVSSGVENLSGDIDKTLTDMGSTSYSFTGYVPAS
jgi:Flp pilus assembly pilin Flp